MNEENQNVNLEAIQESLGGNNLTNDANVAPAVSQPVSNQTLPRVEDIFSDTEVEKPAAFQARNPNEPNLSGEEDAIEKSVNKKNLIKLIISLLLLVAILVGAYFGYNYYVKNGAKLPTDIGNIKLPEFNKDTDNSELNLNQEGETEALVEGENIPQETSPVDVTEKNTSVQDTDGDGISDQDETVRGMDINNNDSDNDGLFDREEIMVYNTDPLNSDTDGDGFSDGAEVDGGYNPNGAGRLYDINQAQ